MTGFREKCSKWLRRFALLREDNEEPETIEMLNFGNYKVGAQTPLIRSSTWRELLTPTREQRVILILMAIVMVVALVLGEFTMGRFILYPFAIISTVFHEFGHAFMVWVTGGHMNSIEINVNEAGATRFHGGWPCAILPAGYIGSALIGAILVFMAFGRKTARWTAVGIMGILIITLFYSYWLFTIISALGLMAMLGLAIWYKEGAFTRHFILILGVCACMQSITSILNTTVFNTVEGSDAYVFARRCSFLIPAFVYGLLWFIISMTLQIVAIGAALITFKKQS